jgi:threonine dehydrogenase-like Zn-dependent dehydrogenase
MIAHESQLFPVDDRMSDKTGALIEPLAVGMHAALRSRPFGHGPALVIGSGPIALGTIWSLRAAGYQGELVAQIKRGHEADIARALGASDVITPGDEARQSLIDTGSSAYMPIIGDEVYAGGGFPLIIDCVGSGQTIKQALRYAASPSCGHGSSRSRVTYATGWRIGEASASTPSTSPMICSSKRRLRCSAW